MSAIFPAQYPFTCGCCGTRYKAGVRARFNDEEEIVAAGCRESGTSISPEEQAKAREQKCQRCWMVHAPHQGAECA